MILAKTSVSGFLLLPILLFAQSTKPSQSVEPNWITTPVISYSATHLDKDAEDGYVELNIEQQTLLAEQTVFHKKAIRVLTEGGVENASEISVDFDPSYQKLVFHKIAIIRGAESINRLQLSKIKMIQQEEERSMHIYNGALTALLILDDVRKNDVVEYSYSLEGFNPIFKNKYAGFYNLQLWVPVYNMFYKLVVPNTRSVTIRNDKSNIVAKQTQANASNIYEWKLENVPALHVEDNTPTWYDGSPSVMISEYKDWEQVVDWAMLLFPPVKNVNSLLQKKITEIETGNSSTENKILSALKIVQDEVRYLGIEMGVNSHKPHAPTEVYAQRFGDCKDKVYLLCTMLAAMKIEAYPVFINTTYKNTISNWLPSPHIFDHVTILVKADGKEYWFDPTIAYQRGTIDDISFPDYKVGLVISESSTAITPIITKNKSKVKIEEEFFITDALSPAKFIVKTVYSGSFADDTRYDFNTTSNYELLKTYRTFYATYFEDIKADSLKSADNKDGSFTTTEFYTIPELYKPNNGTSSIPLQPFVINSYIKRPKNKNRLEPFQIRFPINCYEEIKVHTPNGWDIKETNEGIEINNFRFSSNFSHVSYGTLLLKYDYESLKDHVLPQEMDSYLDGLEKFDEATGFEVVKNFDASTTKKNKFDSVSETEDNFNLLYVLLAGCVVVTYFVRRKRK